MDIYRGTPTGAVMRARALRRNMTDAEKRLWKALRESFPQIKFRKQVPVGPYVADFLSFGARVIIEADGGQHGDGKAQAYDARRTRFLQNEGFAVLRFWNNDILGNIDGVLAEIAKSLSHREREGGAKRRKGEGNFGAVTLQSPSPDLASLGHPLPSGEGK